MSEIKLVKFYGIKGYARVMYDDVKDADKYKIEVAYNGREIKDLLEYLFELENQLQEKENIIKEVREYLNKNEIEEVYLDCKLYETEVYKDILEILDKGE